MKRKEYYEEEPRLYTRAQLEMAGINGVKHDVVPSMTTILQARARPGLYRFYAKSKSFKTANNYRDGRARVGLAVHKKIAAYLSGKNVRVNKKSRSRANLLFRNFLSFREIFHPVADATEEIVYNVRKGYGGTLDFRGRIYDSPMSLKFVSTMIDWKTTSSKHPKDHELQLSGYWAAKRMGFDKLIVVYLMPRVEFRMSQMHVFDEDRARYCYEVAMHYFEGWKYDNEKYVKVQNRRNTRGQLVPVASIIRKMKV